LPVVACRPGLGPAPPTIAARLRGHLTATFLGGARLVISLVFLRAPPELESPPPVRPFPRQWWPGRLGQVLWVSSRFPRQCPRRFPGGVPNCAYTIGMALVKYGAVVTEASGSLDGVTYSRNAFGAYARQRSVPVNPNTPAQTAARTLLTSLSQSWRGLSSAQRNGWNVLATSVVRTNALGESYSPTGQQLYVGTNVNRQNVGLAIVDSAPTLDSAPELVGVSLNAEFSGGLLEIAWTSLVGTGTWLVYATPAVSPGITYFRSSLYKLITTFDDSEVSPFDFRSEYEDYFPVGSEQLGSAIGVRLRPISDNGYAGTDITLRAIID